MAIKVKKGGVYTDPVGIFAKKSGAYSEVAGVSAKIDGAYVDVGASLESQVAELFAEGQQGAWWSANDLSTLFSDAAGTTPAVVGGVVMQQLDKSGRGHHRVNSVSGTSPILRQRSDGAYWLDYSGGKTLNVPASTSMFNYLHDGTGGTLVAFVEWGQGATASNYLQNCTATAQVGIQVIKSSSTQNVSLNVNRGVSGQQAGVASAVRAALSSAPRMLRFSYKNDGGASDVKAAMDSCLDITGTTTLNAPSSANAAAILQVATSFNAAEYEVVIRSGVLSASEVGVLWQYVRQYDYPVPNVDLTLLLGGQSNMSGRGTVITTLPEDKQVGVYIYTKAEEFRIGTVPEHSIANRPIATTLDEGGPTVPQHGFGLRAGKKLNTDAGEKVLLVPCAIGSTSISNWDTPATKTDRTTLFGAMAYRYAQAAQKSGVPVIVWSGHEANAGSAFAGVDYVNGGVGTTYQDAWTQLVADIRAEVVNAPLIFVQLSSDDTLATAEAHAAAGEAQRQSELSISNAYMVVAHDVARNASTDDIHVSRAGMDVIGDRVALAIRQHVLGESVNGTGPRIVGATYSGSVVQLTCDKAINDSVGNFGNLFRVYAAGVEQTVSSSVRNATTSKIDITCSAPLVGAITLTYGYRAGAASAARTDFVMDSDGMPLPLFGPIVAAP